MKRIMMKVINEHYFICLNTIYYNGEFENGRLRICMKEPIDWRKTLF